MKISSIAILSAGNLSFIKHLILKPNLHGDFLQKLILDRLLLPWTNPHIDSRPTILGHILYLQGVLIDSSGHHIDKAHKPVTLFYLFAVSAAVGNIFQLLPLGIHQGKNLGQI